MPVFQIEASYWMMLSNLIVYTTKSCLLDFSFEPATRIMWPGHVTCSCDSHVTQSCHYRIIMWQIAFWLVHPLSLEKPVDIEIVPTSWFLIGQLKTEKSSIFMFWILKFFARKSFKIFIRNKPFSRKKVWMKHFGKYFE